MKLRVFTSFFLAAMVAAICSAQVATGNFGEPFPIRQAAACRTVR